MTLKYTHMNHGYQWPRYVRWPDLDDCKTEDVYIQDALMERYTVAWMDKKTGTVEFFTDGVDPNVKQVAGV